MEKSISYYNNTQSFGSKVFYFIIKLINIKGKLESSRFTDKMTRANMPEPPKRFLATIFLTTHKVNERNVFTLKKENTSPKKYIVFFHGGAYVLNFTLVHWKLITRLVKETDCEIIAPDYPLLPKHTYKERLAMGEQVYKDLLKKTSAANIILMGDSSGGNLALSLAQKLLVDGTAQPSQIILLSPWLDVTMSNPEMQEVSKRDPILPLGDNIVGRLHAGDRDMKDPFVSPLYGSIAGLGRISLFKGTDDILNPDARLIKSKAELENVDFNYFEYKHMVHDWILFPMPEAKMAFKQIVDLLK